MQGANSFGPSKSVAQSGISMFYEQTMLSERLMMASNRRAAKLDNSYGAFLLPAAISCLLAQTRSEGFPGSKNVPAQSGSYLRPPFDTIRELLSIGILHFDWQKPYNSAASNPRKGAVRLADIAATVSLCASTISASRITSRGCNRSTRCTAKYMI